MRASTTHNGFFGESAYLPGAKRGGVTIVANDVGYFGETAAERKKADYKPYKSSFGAYQKEGVDSFDDKFSSLTKTYLENNDIDIRKDMEKMVHNLHFMEQYKEALTKELFEGFAEASPNDAHIAHVCEQVEVLWDEKVRFWNESAAMTNFLPVATLEFPVLLKQFFRSIIKDIIEVEATKTPIISKHIRSTFLVDNQTQEMYEYPKCMFDGTWEEVFEASTGYEIRNEVVHFTAGRLHQYDIIANLTDGVPGFDKLSFNTYITHVYVGNEIIRIRGNGIRIEFAANGTLLNGNLDFEDSESGIHVQDTLGGRVNFQNGTIDVASTSGQVEGIVIKGRLSNEKNMRSVSVVERRDQIRIEIGDGPRWNMPFSIEEINDATALLDINYFNRMVDEIVITQEMQETMTVIRFLNHEFEKYHGIDTDIFNLESLAHSYTVDLQPPSFFAGDPFKYIARAIQFQLKAIIHHLTESVKLDNLSFVIVGNPMATQLIAEFTDWKIQPGSSIGGITVNSSYGFMTDMGASVRVVASNLYDPYTVDPVEHTGPDGNPLPPVRELILHIYAYPTTEEHISFRHLKYTSHLMTSQSQTAYQSVNAPGGAYQIVTATSRFHSFAVQGIQARLILKNSAKVYNEAPPRPPITGAPFAPLTPPTP